MASNGVKSSEDVDMAEAECDGEKVVTMMDVLQEQQEFEDDANAVLGASDDKNCTYSRGYVKRQAIYACLTCCPDAATDPTKRAGVCLACSLACHESHELVELYTKRNFRCDCGNPKFTQACTFTPDKSDLNYENLYNQNFSGIYCTCKRPYPDPETTEEEEMIQCIICEDWLHTNHLEATVPSNEQYAEMICKDCMDEYGFLHDYSDLVVNTIDKEIKVVDPDLDFDIKVVPKKATPTKAARKEIITDSITDNKSDKEADGILDSINSIVNENKTAEEPAEVDKKEEKSTESECVENSTKKIDNGAHSEDHKEAIDGQPDPASTEPKDEANNDLKVEATGDYNVDTLNKEEDETTKDVNNSTKETDETTKDVNESTKEIDENTKEADGSTEGNMDVEKRNKETDDNNKDEMETSDNKEKAEPETINKEATSEEATSSDHKDETPAEIENGQNSEIEGKDKIETRDKENKMGPKAENKRKHSIEDLEDASPKKAKIVEPCLRPKGRKRVYKGATFWPSNLRHKLCSCGECISMYKDLAVLYLIDPDDTVTAYEALGKDNADGPSSQYEKGLQALQSLDRVQQINALTEYNRMRDKLLDFLKSFKDRKEIVKEEDIKAFFAGMKPKREPDGVYFCR